MNQTFAISIADYAAALAHIPGQSAAKQPAEPRRLSDTEKEVFQEARRAWEAYSADPANRQQLEALPAMNLESARAMVGGILRSPAFQELLKIIEDMGIDAGSFSVGVNFEAELGIGLSGTLGAAVGIGNNKGLQSSEFLSISVVEGIEEGAMTGVQIGLWNNAPADLGGYAWGTEVAAGFIAEVRFDAYYTASDGPLGATVTFGAGEEDGASETESYTFILGDQGSGAFSYIRPVYQEPKANLLILQTLNCVNPSSDGGSNEVYFIFQADGGNQYPYPTYDYYAMEEGDSWQCGRSVWFDSSVTVTVYDDDGTSGDDVLATFSINLSDLPLNQPRLFNSTKNYSSGLDDVEYTMNVMLVAQNVNGR